LAVERADVKSASIDLVGTSRTGENATGVTGLRVIRGGTVYDGSGGAPVTADVTIVGDRIATIGVGGDGADEIDASGLAVAPGFINMLSWATESLIEDGRGQSDVRQGVTLEVFGEGESMGPLNVALAQELVRQQTNIRYEIEWTTLGEYLEYLERRGVAPNVASFVGAATVRAHAIGYDDREPTAAELEQMKALVRAAMSEGAMGVGAALIYPPGCYAQTAELIELARVATESDGLFTAHLRSEGDRLLEGLDELIAITHAAGIRAQVHHLKAAGTTNWPKLDAAIEKIEQARKRGLEITANMYTYTAGGTGLSAGMPPWVQEGGADAWRERLRDPQIRARVEAEMIVSNDKWENLYLLAGPENIRFTEFASDALRPYTGRTLADVARERGLSPAQTAMQLVLEDGSRVEAAFTLMSEENVRREVGLPWMSFCSDSIAAAPEGVFLQLRPHPRAYGSFARLLGRYVRDEGVAPLEDAVRRLTSLPADNLRLHDRGRLHPGYFADIVVFDPEAVADNATFDDPHQYASGVVHVLVNGTPVIRDGEHTGALPGRVVRGRAWQPRRD
jgi:N-acyl-D-amino-acid deacylase